MRLSEGIGRMLDHYRNISRVIVHVPEAEEREQASEWFEVQYLFRLRAKLAEFEQDFGRQILNDPNHAGYEYFGMFPDRDPFWIEPSGDGFIIHVNELQIRPFDEGYYYPGYGENAFEQALKDLKTELDGVSYEGYINYMLCDLHGGELVSYEITDKPEIKSTPKRYDWIGKAIGECLAQQIYLPGKDMPSAEEAEKLHFTIEKSKNHLKDYETEQAIEYILGANLDERLLKTTDYLLVGEKTGSRRQEKKAQEYGIPILTQEEFHEKFGLTEYQKNGSGSVLCCCLENAVTEDDMEKEIRCLYAYREWIRPEILEAVVQKILRMLAKEDPEAAERLRRKTEEIADFR